MTLSRNLKLCLKNETSWQNNWKSHLKTDVKRRRELTSKSRIGFAIVTSMLALYGKIIFLVEGVSLHVRHSLHQKRKKD